MTSTKAFIAAALLSTMTATPVFAQAAIQEPGEFAFYHPNLDVLNGGAPPWTAPLASRRPQTTESYAAGESGIAARAAHRHRAYNFMGDAYRNRSRR
jgi:hypothetical protein